MPQPDDRNALTSIVDPLVLKSLGFYSALHALAALVIRKRVPKGALLTRSDLVFLAEKFPSTISALVTALPSFYLHVRSRPWKHDVITPYPKLFDDILAQHIGYTIYDLAVMVYVGGQHPSAWIHHLLGVAGTAFMRYYRVAGFFPAVFLPTEITVIATNALWVLQKFGKDKGKVYGFWLLVRALLFCCIRAPAGLAGLVYALQVVRKQNAATDLKNRLTRPDSTLAISAAASNALIRPPPKAKAPGSLWTQLRRLPFMVWFLTAVNYMTFSGLNLYWSRLVLIAFKRFNARSTIHHI
ncbi:hypothetical protein PhCBS80983_g02536 [Powellomyces hirtus]|uniref:TLC domain-containing protein n=1 Tax=Powellomyces hirtus TaxID=109895 RepID=A0A507E677_9FUNG|nr:hypothetical protein PhCBS80983_g02536 [Powellomyces hirtus]